MGYEWDMKINRIINDNGKLADVPSSDQTWLAGKNPNYIADEV